MQSVLRQVFLVSLFLGISFCSLLAQRITVFGEVVSEANREVMIGATVQLIAIPDSVQIHRAVTDTEGRFMITDPEPGTYRIQINYLAHHPYADTLVINPGPNRLGTLIISPDEAQLDEVTVEAIRARATQRGDTTVYHADAYQTHRDASAEDLVRRMPGITTEGGQVQAQGEEVRRVTVDGREFFGEDATLALRNLPAEIIQQVQVFDQMSDQSRFTGFDDGNTSKTINIVTRPGMNTGRFGRIYAGYGTDDRYSAGGNINFFNGARRVSILGLSNNINQQNFSAEDLVGVASEGSRGGRGGRRGPGGGPGVVVGQGGWGGGGAAGNFLTGDQSGINTTHSAGLNYSDEWGKRIKAQGSYFYNQTENNTFSLLERTYFLPDETFSYYNEDDRSNSTNHNHRFSGRIEFDIDSFNSIIWTPRLNVQQRSSASITDAEMFNNDMHLLNRLFSDQSRKNDAIILSNNLLYRHRFAAPRRTFSINLNQTYNLRTGESNLYSVQEYFMSDMDSILETDQFSDQQSTTQQYGASLTYTEPAGRHGMVQFQYAPSIQFSGADRLTFHRDAPGGEYELIDTMLSNVFEQKTHTQRGGLSYRYNQRGFNISIGVDYQHVQIENLQTFPFEASTALPYSNLLPNAMFGYRFESGANLRLFYRTRTQIPTVQQLQSVVDNSNPLLLSTGNPDLEQSYTHSTFIRFQKTMPQTARTFFVFAGGSLTSGSIGQSTLIARTDTVLPDGIMLLAGSQLNRPVNLDGAGSLRSFFTYGTPLLFMKSNLNLNGGVNYSRNPGLINGAANIAHNLGFNGGVFLSSNISEKVDFTVSTNTGYNIVQNSLRPQLDNNYYTQTSSIRFNWLPWKGLVLQTDYTHQYYYGLSDDFDPHYMRWNASIGYKFLDNQAAEIRLTAFDLLAQNNSLSRTVTDAYIEDAQTNLISRYFMMVFTYNLRQFNRGQQSRPG